MSKFIADVKLFHDKFGLVTPDAFTFLPDDLHAFRTGFFEEEFKEYTDAVRDNDLATALDSLIDLVYITAGAALLHGFAPTEFQKTVIENTEDSSELIYDLFESNEPARRGPSFLAETGYEMYVRCMRNAIDTYNEAHRTKNYGLTLEALAALYCNQFYCGSDMGVTNDCWVELWDDVQRANMTKERALKPSDSKRGSVWDVVKPAGWIPPRTEQIVLKHAAEGAQA